ncbi:ADP-ribosyltransferase domain-containing protein [Mycolicibacterium frederiksbergense]|uniref:NAD(+)--protein-arginine ADP-ribosyltransferase n=1 Tax=Mycolicibacterium frederiksbergense TaxID=117567 RepID=A0A6H0RZH5_9MYCO|nr:ADP-ribosyltransferase domain-containing protein [Mycolicibacterium frederiksbergense]QIV79639.1 hypothetical protein EXE63_00930 [Mycolicibacterium frederiksbergense]
MCLATTEPGGPRRCSGDTRAAYEKSATAAHTLDARHQQLHHALTAHDATDRHRAATALPPAQRDELLAGFTPEDIDALAEARRQQIRPAVDAAFAATPTLQLADTPRDTTIAEHAEISIHRPHGTDTMRATCLDANTAVYRTRRGDYAIAYQDGEAYRTIATASKYKTALTKANQIPALTPIGQPPGGIDDLQQQAHRARADTALQLATRAAHGQLTTPDEQAAFLAERLTHAREEIVDAAAATPLHNEILDATTRHRHHQQHIAAQAAGDAARRAAEPAGQDTDAAYTAAYRNALGTPTRGGAHIPHFAHHVLPAPSIGADTHTTMARNGLRAYGPETVDDYTVIRRRGEDLTSWGLRDVYGTLRPTHIAELTKAHSRFVNTALTTDERDALRTYTSGRHIGSGAYIQINDVFTGRTTTPSPAVANTCTHLRSAFDKYARHNTMREPVTVVRGTHVPSEWATAPSDYLATAFPIGAKVELGQVASATTRTTTATKFADREPGSYLMVIRTRDGLPVKAISANAGEDEVIIPPGTALRCVRVDAAGVEHRPTVYLVAEDLVAEAEAEAAERAQKAS